MITYGIWNMGTYYAIINATISYGMWNMATYYAITMQKSTMEHGTWNTDIQDLQELSGYHRFQLRGLQTFPFGGHKEACPKGRARGDHTLSRTS